MERRLFLALGAAGLTLAGTGCRNLKSPTSIKAFETGSGKRRPIDVDVYYPNPPQKSSKPLKVLFLGGTNFLGPATVQWLTLRGHDVTLFNRGQTQTYLFPEHRKIKGDRLNLGTAYDGLGRDEKWDVVIDSWSQAPESVKDAALFFKSRTDHYIYISTISVYTMENYRKKGIITEETPLPDGPGLESVPQTDLDYTDRKLASDQAIRDHWDEDKLTVVRPHLIPGPFQEEMDGVETYWAVRTQLGGDILAPGDGQDPTQWVDVRDVAQFITASAENGTIGTYNLGQQQSLKTVLTELQKLSRKPSKFHWVDWPKLQEMEVGPFHELPMYVPQQEGRFYNISDAKALSAGMTYRSIADVYPLILEDFYYQFGTVDFPFGKGGKPGLSPEREAELLKGILT